jgi:hypothetical protein
MKTQRNWNTSTRRNNLIMLNKRWKGGHSLLFSWFALFIKFLGPRVIIYTHKGVNVGVNTVVNDRVEPIKTCERTK